MISSTIVNRVIAAGMERKSTKQNTVEVMNVPSGFPLKFKGLAQLELMRGVNFIP
jgi:hypothetical protein